MAALARWTRPLDAATFGGVRIEERVRELIVAGTATVVATRDEAMRPALTRGWGVAVAADGSELTLCLEAAEGSAVRANLEANGSVAITCSQPATYRTVQVKGEAVGLAEPSPGQLVAVERHVEAFSAEVEPLGLPPGAGQRLLGGGLVAVRVRPREVFDQTPGPKAGTRL